MSSRAQKNAGERIKEKATSAIDENAQRIALGIEYNGHGFSGYQMQSHGTRTVQHELEKALSIVADEPVRLTCAGRTDTGVHATGQVVHFDTAIKRELKAWMLGGNTNLPGDVSIHWVREVSNDFSARFSAISRSYRYVLFNRRTRPAIFKNNVAWSYELLDGEAMNSAAQILLGKHDFSAFRSSRCQANNAIRTMQKISIQRQSDYLILDIQANAFLHHMVRNIMGSLLVIGRGEQTVEWLQAVLQSGDRNLAGMTASPAGLYLVNVEYPEGYGLPESGWLPNFT